MGNSAGNGSPFLRLVCVLGIIKKIYTFYYFVAQCQVNWKENEKKSSVSCIRGRWTQRKEKVSCWKKEEKEKTLILEGDELSLLSDTLHETVGELLFFPLSLHLAYIYLQNIVHGEDEDHLPTKEEENERGRKREGRTEGRETVREWALTQPFQWLGPGLVLF